MKYYELTTDMSGENDIVCHYDNDFGIEQNKLITGEYFNVWNENFSFYYNEAEGEILTDHLPNDKGWFLVSTDLKNIISELTEHVQFINVKITNEITQNVLNTYYICNILNVVPDALNLEHSTYFTINTTKTGEVHVIMKYAVNQDKLKSEHIFKLPENYNIPLFVSEVFKKKVKEKNITGLDFLEVKAVGH
jgi:hypothetical protein